MKLTYRIEIGIRKGQGRILLKEKVDIERNVMRNLLDVLLLRKPMAMTNIILEELDLTDDASIESIEIRED